MTNRIFLTDRLLKKHGRWLKQGLTDALFHICPQGNIFEIEPDAILLAEGQSIQFIQHLSVPKIFISEQWIEGADDCVPPELHFVVAAIKAQIQLYQQRAPLDYYTEQAHHYGLLQKDESAQDAITQPGRLKVFASEEDYSLLEIQLHDYHHVHKGVHQEVDFIGQNFDGIIVKDDLEQLALLSSKAQGEAIFFWSKDRAKLYRALEAGFECIPHLSQAEPRITKRLAAHRKMKLGYQQLHNSLEKAARDSLTGLYNYRCLRMHLDEAITHANRSNRLLGVILFDLDNFKKINDDWGHSSGDSLLQKVAELLGEGLRQEDSLYRIGGDEFVAIIQNFDTLEEIEGIANRFCSIVRETYFVANEEVIPVTLSAGVACYQQGEDMQTLLRYADEALYNAKHAGRNRVALYAS